MAALGRLGEAEEAFTAAAMDPSRWDAAMETAATAAGGYGAMLFPIKGRLPKLPMSQSMEASAETYFGKGWHLRDERYLALPALNKRGVATDLDFMTADAMGRHPYYQDFLARHGLRWFVGIMVANGDDQWCLTIQRRADQDPFSPEEQRRCATLSRRLSGTVAVAQALGFARAEGVLSAFEASGTAVVLFDRSSRVLRINESARGLLGPDLWIGNGRLASRSATAAAALDRALASLLWQAEPSHQTQPVVLPREGARPIIAYPMRIPGICSDILAPCAALAVLVDLDRKVKCPEDVLRASFGLTPAEARLAMEVATGTSVEAAAGTIGIAYETARHQLKSVYAKTDTHRQSELVNLLARFPSIPSLRKP